MAAACASRARSPRRWIGAAVLVAMFCVIALGAPCRGDRRDTVGDGFTMVVSGTQATADIQPGEVHRQLHAGIPVDSVSRTDERTADAKATSCASPHRVEPCGQTARAALWRLP